MKKYIGVIIGGAVAVLGLLALKSWWGEFLMIVKGTLPLIFIFGGAIAVIAALAEIKDESAAKKEENK
jgi:hypothetical protein